MTKAVVGIMLAGLAMAAAQSYASEKKVQLKDVPQAVQAAVRAETNGDTIKGVLEESSKGKVVYEVETTRNGKTRDLVFDAAGSLIEAEEEMAFEAIPTAAQTALRTHGKVTKVEAVRNGTAVTYEAQVEKAGKRSEVVVNADGRVIKQ